MLLRSLCFAALLSACASEASGPAAPTNLSVSPLGAGAHLTWKDNSSDESEFVIMRMEQGVDTAMVELARVPFNGTSFHDEPIVAGAVYVYQIIATNDDGESESNAATFGAP
jgi:hypothetical protein